MGARALAVCDWGTTTLRAWALDADGQIMARREFEMGVATLRPGEAAERFRTEVRPALGAVHLPAILCGMIGSEIGWARTDYVDAPATADALARGLHAVEDGGRTVLIVPGVRTEGFNGQGDVMRGEETQLFGWLAADPSRQQGRHVVCHPGAQTKWMLVEDGRLTRFVTAVTGELFALLTTHGALRQRGPADDGAAFDEGVGAAGDGQALAARLFTARSRLEGLGRSAQSSPSYLSGLLIGADVAATPALLGVEPDERIDVLGDTRLCGLYARAMQAQGMRCAIHDGETAAIAGLYALYQARQSV